MDTFLYSKRIPVLRQYDVVVCGGGPAGIGAALAAAEQGCKTALIERFGFLGGMATAGYVNPMSEFAYNGKRVLGGMAWRFAQALVEAKGGLVEYPRANLSFHPETYKLVAQEMLLKAGVTLYLNSYLVDCVIRDGHIESVLFVNKSGIWMVNSLSKYLRMSINKVSAFVTLRQELELGHIYLDMMQKRFDNRFSVVFDIEENAIDCLLPRLLLQPIMENALIHGLLYCDKSNAALQIRAWCEKNVLFVEIEDNGSGMSKEKLEAFTHPVPGQGGYGLRNIRKRLELFGGTGAEIRIHSKENVGTCVSITLPVKRHD